MARALHHILGSSRTLLWCFSQVQWQMGSLQFEFYLGLVWGTQKGGQDSFFTPRGGDLGQAGLGRTHAFIGMTWPHCVLCPRAKWPQGWLATCR